MFYFIATAAENNEAIMERTIECFRGFTDCLPGDVEKGVINAYGVWDKGDVKGTKFMDIANSMGKDL